MISLSTSVFGSETAEHGLEAMLECAASAGFTHLELSRHHALQGRGELVGRSGLRTWAVHGILGGGSCSLDESERRAAVADEVARMEETAVLGARPYVIHYLPRYHDPRRGESYRRSVEELLVRAQALGLVLAIETAPYKPLHNERYPDSREIAGFVRSFASAAVQMTIDINHSNLHESLREVCGHCRGLIATVHISDNHGEWEDHLPPGEGIIDFAGTFRALRANGYTGPCNLEFHAPEPPTPEGLDAIRRRTLELIGEA